MTGSTDPAGHGWGNQRAGVARRLLALALPAVATIGVASSAQGELRSINVAGGQPVVIYVPAGGRAGPRPLVLLLHGSQGTGPANLRDTGLVATARRHGFVVAAPTGGIALDRGYAWNVPGVPTVSGKMPDASARDDVAYLDRVLDDLVARHIADPHRLYVTGISGGGRMASWLACVDAARVAAVAPVVGLRAGAPSASDPREPDPATCRPGMPVPIFAFAGDRDTTNPIEGGAAPYWRYSMEAAERRWAALDGCQPVAQTSRDGASAYERRYRGCRAGSEVAARITMGGQHSWKVADNEAMWRFFSRHRR